MDQATRNSLQNATQQARRLLEREITEQLEGVFDVLPNGTIADKPGQHLDASQRLVRTKIVEAIRHRAGGSAKADMLADAVDDYVREAAFTILNRYIALKMLEVRGLVQQCITKGDQSSGFKEFGLAATGLAQLPDKGYRLYLESLFDELSTEVKVLFDRHSDASCLWPRRQAFDGLLEILNADELATVWKEDETIGWVYQFFNSIEERKAMRAASRSPRDSRELAVRNQFFTPRYVVEFLTDNTLGRIWYEMRQGVTAITEKCRYLVRRPDEVFFSSLSVPSGSELQGPPLFAKFLAEPALGSLLPFAADRPQALIELAHCVDAYARHPFGQEIEGQWWPWHTKARMEAATSLAEFTTQDILDVMFCQCRADRHGDGDGITDDLFIRLANQVRQRVLDSREPDRTQRQLLKQPVFVPFRAKKDPRDLKILDPACGSSHFLIYCFDLLLTIYDEAWHDDSSPPSQITGNTLKVDYPTIEALHTAAPGLILRTNVHGIDIDPRCAQIGALALWMRAQRAHSDVGIPKERRPEITKVNVVVAEPMPGEVDLLREFTSTLTPRVLGQLVEVVFDQMRLAGETGTLLRLEEDLRAAVSLAKKQWLAGPKAEQMRLFGESPKSQNSQLSFDLSDINDDAFWHHAETQTLAALERYSSKAESERAYTRKLFAQDAAAGLALVDLLRAKYDVLLMNPPFGASSRNAKGYIESRFPRTSGDLLANFVERGLSLLVANGRLGAISSRTPFFLGSFEGFRCDVLEVDGHLDIMADLGDGVLDAMVETAMYTIDRRPRVTPTAMFIRSLVEDDKDKCILEVLSAVHRVDRDSRLFVEDPREFRRLRSSPYAYWVSASTITALAAHPALEGSLASIRVGLQTGDDERFLRLSWEVDASTIVPRPTSTEAAKDQSVPSRCRHDVDAGGRWAFFSKTDSALPWVSPIHLVVKWTDSGAEMRAFVDEKGRPRSALRSESLYFQPGFSYMLRSTRLVPYLVPAGVIPTAGRAQVYPAEGQEYSALALCASNIGTGVARFSGEMFARPKFQASIIQNLPACPLRSFTLATVSRAIDDQVRVRQSAFAAFEPDPLFVAPAEVLSLPTSPTTWEIGTLLGASSEQSIASVYGLQPDQLEELERDIREAASLRASSPSDDEQDDDQDQGSDAVAQSLVDTPLERAIGVLQYAVGCAFGRWDVRIGKDPGLAPTQNGPFDPLPCCPPGMLVGPSGLPAVRGAISSVEWLRSRRRVGLLPESQATPEAVIDDQYPIPLAWNGILVHDVGHADDLAARCTDVLRILGSDIESRVLSGLGCDRDDLRTWFDAEFFTLHIARYSKARRKAPIYWQISTNAGGYSFWLYYARMSPDSLFRMLNDYLRPKLAHEEIVLGRRRDEAGQAPTNSQRRELEAQASLVNDLRQLAEEIAIVAPLWKPCPEDGVLLNAAVLWRLFERHKTWQKECKQCWDSLVAGEYEWSQVAMRLWPERVMPKCVSDPSLAIAHGLVEVFWEQDKKQKWVRRKPPQDAGKAGWQPTIDRLVAEITSRQVKDALSNMLTAPVAEGGKRGRRAAATTGESAAAGNGTKRKGKASKARDESEELF